MDHIILFFVTLVAAGIVSTGACLAAMALVVRRLEAKRHRNT